MPSILIVVLLFLTVSCKEELTYHKLELQKMASDYDPTFEILLSDSLDNALKQEPCAGYGDGCVTSFKVKVKKLEVVAVEFRDTKAAMTEAKRIDQFYSRNWVFDDITGEPDLEKFVRGAFQAIRPKVDGQH